MSFEDIPRVIYAPVQAFKKIVANPKYLAAIVILLLFIGVMIGYEAVQFSKTYTEQTAPTVDQLPTYINSTAWTSGSGVTLTDNATDFFNYSIFVPALNANYSLFGNTSLQISGSGSELSAALGNTSNVNCGAGGFENLSMTIKFVTPQTPPQSSTITLYTTDTNYYTYDLTSAFSNSSAVGLWENVTLGVGPQSQGWTASGSPSWSNITALKLDFTYPSSSDITIHVGALFFHGKYESFSQAFGITPILSFLEAFALQFLFSWFLLTGLIYLFFKGLKGTITWKPLFIAVAFALFVMVIRGVVNLAAAATLPTEYYPYDLALTVSSNAFGALFIPSQAIATLAPATQAIANSITAATANFGYIITVMFLLSYVWLGALCTILVGALQPTYSMVKRIAISAGAVIITILLLALLVGLL